MNIAWDAWRFFLPLISLAAVLFLAGLPGAGAVAAGLSAFVLFFFRDPEREIPPQLNAVVSPADGKVVRVEHGWHDETTGETRARISIFLSVFNVHINRFPVSGKIVRKELRPGKFLAAFNHMASEENAQSVVVINSEYGKVTVKQIVGLIARRVVCHAEEGQDAVKGERYGLIRFGSRVDITLPATAEIVVNAGDRVEGGSSVLAYLKS